MSTEKNKKSKKKKRNKYNYFTKDDIYFCDTCGKNVKSYNRFEHTRTKMHNLLLFFKNKINSLIQESQLKSQQLINEKNKNKKLKKLNKLKKTKSKKRDRGSSRESSEEDETESE